MKSALKTFLSIFMFCVLLAVQVSHGLAQESDPGKTALKIGRQLKEKAKSRSDLEKARKKFEESFVMFSNSGSKKDAAVALHEIAIIHEDMAEHEKALQYYQKSLALRKEAEDTRGQGYCLNAMAFVHNAMSQYGKAMEIFTEALGLAEQVNDRHLQALVLQNIANIEMNQGKNKQARERLEKSLSIFKDNPNKRYEAGCLNDIGELNRRLGYYQKAIDNYEKALAINRSIDNVKGQSWNYNNIGLAYLSLGKYRKASESFELSLEIKNKLDDNKGKSNAFNNIGLVYFSSGQYALALENFERGLALYQKVANRKGESTALSNIGRVYAHWGKLDKALESYQDSIKILVDIGLPTSWTKDLVANLYMDKGDMEKAQAFLKESNYNRSWGRYHLIKGDHDSAKESYEKLLKSSEKNRNAEGLFVAYVGLGKVYEAKEDYARAEQFYEKGLDLAEDLRSMMLPSERKNFFEAKIGGFYRWEPAKGLTRVRMKLNKDAQSIEASEAVRARFFADSISQRSEGGVSGIPNSVLEQEETLTNRLANLKKDLAKIDRESQPDMFKTLSRETTEAQDDLNAFIESLWKKHYQYAAIKYPKPVPLKQSAVKPDEFLIVYDVVDEGVGVKLVRGHEILQTNYLKWSSEELASDINKFRHCFENFNLSEFNPQLAHKIYKKLLEPVIGNVPRNEKLVIIPDGPLGVLPFEALVVSGNVSWSKGPYGPVPKGLTYMADLYRISYYQSITALTLLRKSEKSGKHVTKRLLVVADPVFTLADSRIQSANEPRVASGDTEHFTRVMAAIEDSFMGRFRFDRLPQTQTLAASLNEIYSGTSDLLTGFNASKSKLLTEIGPKLMDYSYLVFATHGLYSNKIPGVNEPFLALTMAPPGTDGFLKMSEVLSLKMDADLVALTACQTGLGNDLSGEGVMSMGRAFQFAGAKCALMSLWSVAENSSVDLVESFFRGLRQGKTRIDALVEARTQLREKGYEHPFYWAPFILVGEVGAN